MPKMTRDPRSRPSVPDERRAQGAFARWPAAELARPRAWFVALGLMACGGAEPPSPSAPAAPVALAPLPSSAQPAPAPPLPAKPDAFAVAGENASAVEVARATLEAGGSAADAAIAGVLVGCAAHPSSCGLGGGGSALIATQGKVTSLDFREAAPLGLRREDHLGKHQRTKKSGRMIGVPGLAAGLVALHDRGGRLPLSEVCERAADAIERGVPLSPYAAQVATWYADWLHKEAATTSLGLIDAESRVGEPIKNAALARLIRQIGADRARSFYDGPLAETVVSEARASGSRLTRKDLARYAVNVGPALSLRLGERVLTTAPPPAAGGLLALQIVALPRDTDLTEPLVESDALAHVLGESIRWGHSDRSLLVGDPAFTKADPSPLLDRTKLDARRAAVDPNRTTMPSVRSVADGGTMHLSVVDEAGTAVALTASIGSAFGCRTVSSLGFVYNDALAEFTMDDYGQRAATKGPNFPRGGARPVSSHAPVVVLRGERVELVGGASGGLRAGTALGLVLLRHLRQGVPLEQAVAAPRLHVPWSGALLLETPLAGLEPKLVARGEVVRVEPANFASVSAIAAREEEGLRRLLPVFDPRKGGAVTVQRSTK